MANEPANTKNPPIDGETGPCSLLDLFDDKVNTYYAEKVVKHDPKIIEKAMEFWDLLSKTAKSDFGYRTVVLIPDTLMPKFEKDVLDEVLDVLFERYGVSAKPIHTGWRFHIPFFNKI